jgi:hypothetical protein
MNKLPLAHLCCSATSFPGDIHVSSSEPNAARNAHSPAQSQGQRDAAPARSFDLQRLDRVLESTLAQLSASHVALPAELVEVGHRHRGAPLSLQIVRDLVCAVLQPDWQELAGGTADFEALCAQIAETLFEDPVAHMRLRSMWSGLAGTLP